MKIEMSAALTLFLLALAFLPGPAAAVELAAGTVTVSGGVPGLVEAIQPSVSFNGACCPSARLFDGLVVGPGDVGRTFRVTRNDDPQDFDAAVQQLTDGLRQTLTFFATAGFEPSTTVFEDLLFPPAWLVPPGGTITAMTLRLDALTLLPLPPGFGAGTHVEATLTLAVEGTSPGAGLALIATSNPQSVVLPPPPGSGDARFAHVLTVRNEDVVPAGAVELTFGPSASVQVTGVTASTGTCVQGNGGVYTCDLGSLESGAEATVTIDQATPGAGYYQTNATAIDRLPPGPSPNTPRLASAVTRVLNPVTADLSVTNFGFEYSPGFVEYRLRIVNNGPAAATGLRVVRRLPEGAALPPPGNGPCQGYPSPIVGPDIACDVSGPPFFGNTFFFSYFVNAFYSPSGEPIPPGTELTSRATVMSLEVDPTPANNTATARVVVGAPVDLEAVVIPPAQPVPPGTPVTYTIRVTNRVTNQPNPATSIMLDHPSFPGTVQSVGGPGWTCYEPPVHCLRAGLGIGESTDLTVTVAPPHDSFDIDGFVHTSNLELNPGNNQFHATILVVAAPAANAGPDQTLDEGASVTLDGTGSTGQALTFQWQQTAGPPVTLSGENTASPTFTAPTLGGGFGSQVLTFSLTVGSSSLTSTDGVNVTVKNVNHGPSADAGPDQTVREGASVTLDGRNSFDEDGDALTFSWVQREGSTVTLLDAHSATPTFDVPLLPGGIGGPTVLVFALTVSDGERSSTDEVQVTVEQENHAPTANAGPDQTRSEGALVVLDGSGSMDSDGDPISFQWTQVSGPPVSLDNTAQPTFLAPSVGAGGAALTFQLVVSDGALASTVDEVVVTVGNINDPPRCDLARPSRPVLWPPDHKLVPVGISGVTDPDNDRVTLRITRVTQDEPVKGTGDADTSPDAVVRDGTVQLRAERIDDGNGRVYRVAFTADDGRSIDGVCSGAVTVAVPPNMRTGTVAVDDGQHYDATSP
jgi:hypothetical protein